MSGINLLTTLTPFYTLFRAIFTQPSDSQSCGNVIYYFSIMTPALTMFYQENLLKNTINHVEITTYRFVHRLFHFGF